MFETILLPGNFPEWSKFATMIRIGGILHQHRSLKDKISVVQAMVDANRGVGGQFNQVSLSTD